MQIVKPSYSTKLNELFPKIRITFHNLAIVVCILGFYSFYLVSAVLYPGGTWEDETTVGYSFCNNYLCDVWQPTALNGLLNPGRIYGLIAIGMHLAALLLMYNLLAKLLAKYSLKLAKVVLVTSFLVFTGCFLVSFVFPPEEKVVTYHSIIVMMTALCGLLAIVLSLVCFLRMPVYSRLGKLGLVLFIPIIVNIICYIAFRLEVVTWCKSEPLLINLQKISIVAVSIFALLIAYRHAQEAAKQPLAYL